MKNRYLLIFAVFFISFCSVNAQTVEAKIFEKKNFEHPEDLKGHIGFIFSGFSDPNEIEKITIIFEIESSNPNHYLNFALDKCNYQKDGSIYTFDICYPGERLTYRNNTFYIFPYYNDDKLDFEWEGRPGSIVLIGAITDDGSGGRVMNTETDYGIQSSNNRDCHSININILKFKYKKIEDDNQYMASEKINASLSVGHCPFVPESESIPLDNTSTSREDDSALKVYPLPANEELMISDLDADNQELRLIDLSGKVHFQHNNENNGSITIPTRNLPNGYYFLQIKKDNQIKNLKVPIIH